MDTVPVWSSSHRPHHLCCRRLAAVSRCSPGLLFACAKSNEREPRHRAALRMILIKVATCLASLVGVNSCSANKTTRTKWMQICFEYLNGLYSYALVLSRNHADAEDLVQQTYVRAMRATGKLRADSNTKCRFFTILRNIWVTQLRKRRSAPQSFETGMDDVSQ